MLHVGPGTTLWGLVFIQVLGLTSAWLTRLGEGSTWQTPLQRLFFACLVLVGLVTLRATTVGPGSCLAGGTTLALMVLAATWQPRIAHGTLAG